MVPRRCPGSARHMTGASLVAALSWLIPPAPGTTPIEHDKAILCRVFPDHCAPSNGRVFATLPHQDVAQRPA